MSAWTIVALPKEEDPVNKISSEKQPHMTLLFLGEHENDPAERRIASFLMHVAQTSVRRFGLSVDRRGILGPKQADVLFFGEDNLEKLRILRSNLLQDPDILEAYNSTEQYPQWTPHLTLGYPETPAHKDDREYPGIGWVGFDRIALWNDDYEGYEFLLKEDESMGLSHSIRPRLTKPEPELKHIGVKGMKWGHRKGVSITPSDDHVQAKALAKKKPSELSNKELQALNNRKQLEKKYTDLNPTISKKGRQQIAGILALGATAGTAIALARGPVGQLGKDAIKTAIKLSMSNSGKHVLVEAAKATARHV